MTVTSAAASAAIPAFLPLDAPIPGGIGGAVSDGAGGVRSTTAVNKAALQRAWAAVAAMGEGLPAVTAAGDLPAGIHHVAWNEVTRSLASTSRRADLTAQLGHSLGVMHAAGVEQVVVGGSYVGSKPHPGDVDIAVLPRRDGAQFNWSAIKRTLARTAPDVHVYAGDRIVSNANRLPGGTAGESFLEFFMHDRSGAARGAILLETGPAAEAAPVRAAVDDAARAAIRGLAYLRA
ncbi:MAG: nucleotidyltransferase domain-containing protein [Thermoleophilia bacterium]|nr:nucleotidyltransferase domain-containing protein [Thermoleophilia bacterium]